jgi:hypothetical protein
MITSEDIFGDEDAEEFISAVQNHSQSSSSDEERDKDCESSVKSKGMLRAKEKHRLTSFLCVNATGSHKLNLMIIGSAAKPRCFSAWEPQRDGRVLYATYCKERY